MVAQPSWLRARAGGPRHQTFCPALYQSHVVRFSSPAGGHRSGIETNDENPVPVATQRSRANPRKGSIPYRFLACQ
jgi:hypothetical protein